MLSKFEEGRGLFHENRTTKLEELLAYLKIEDEVELRRLFDDTMAEINKGKTLQQVLIEAKEREGITK